MKDMYQKIRNLLFHTLVPAVLAALMLPTMAFAQEQSCTATIPVEIKVTGSNIPSDASYRLVLEGVTAGVPMPETTVLTVNNGGTASFGPITYTVPEDYQYRIYQNTDARDYFTYDQTVYNLTVRVLTDQDGNLTAEIWAVNTAAGDSKAGEIVFNNEYTYTSGNGGGGGGGNGGGSSGSGGGGSSGGTTTSTGTVTVGDGLTTIESDPAPLAGLFPEAITSVIPDDIVPLAMLPKTGDTTNIALWLVLIAISGSGLLLLTGWKKRMESEA